jgi:hypothetical membrane protein
VKQRLGAISWILTIAYFVAQPIVAAAWDPAYSFSNNTISDLGNARCGPSEEPWRRGAYLCSPRHALMNVVFVLVGFFTVLGAWVARDYWPSRRLAKTGLALVALSGVGGILVGLAPGDVNLSLHLAGAALQFPAAVGPLLLGLATPRERRWERTFSFAIGALGIVGVLLFVSGLHVGLGVGGTERLAFDPLTAWTVVLGGVILWRASARRPVGMSQQG